MAACTWLVTSVSGGIGRELPTSSSGGRARRVWPNTDDVLVVGKPDVDELFALAEKARSKLHREVNIRFVRPTAWNNHDSKDPFLAHVRSRPLIELNLERANP